MVGIEGSLLILPSGHSKKFHELIHEFIPFDDVVVVRIATESVQRTNENVYGVDYRGNLLWQIPWRSHLCEYSPYVALYRNNSHVDAYNWDGHDLTIDPKTGVILLETYLVGFSVSRRPKSVRKFI